MAKLTDKQSMFVQEYLIDLNATQAAIRAGYKSNTAQQIGSENLSKPVLQDAIQAAMEDRANRTHVTQDMVIEELAKIAFLDIRKAFDNEGNLIPIKDLPEDVARAIGGIDHSIIGSGDEQLGITSKIKIIDKKGSLELLGKHLKMFTEKHEHTGKDGGPMTVNISHEDVSLL